MGGISSMLKFIPGIKNLGDKANTVSDDAIKKQEAIILSMTKLERRKPKMINSSRKQRIAKGDSTDVHGHTGRLEKLVEQYLSPLLVFTATQAA